jgi:exopolysaccharide production protein ExoY
MFNAALESADRRAVQRLGSAVGPSGGPTQRRQGTISLSTWETVLTFVAASTRRSLGPGRVAGSKTEKGRCNGHVRQPVPRQAVSRIAQLNPVLPAGTTRSISGKRSAAQCPRIPRVKRVVDILMVCLALPLLAPLMFLIAIYIKSVSRGPILYRQQRVGHGEVPFELLKFRSMRPDADSVVHESHTARLLTFDLPLTKMDERGDPRLIPLGRLLRASGLDELPQIFNVLRGEMSLVGPRPCTRYEFALLNVHQKARFRALPGITGLWQVSGKNKTTFSQMLDLDTAYVNHWSMGLDLKIMVRTLPVLVSQVQETRGG